MVELFPRRKPAVERDPQNAVHGGGDAFEASAGVGVPTAFLPAAAGLAAVRALPFQARPVGAAAVGPEAARQYLANDIADAVGTLLGRLYLGGHRQPLVVFEQVRRHRSRPSVYRLCRCSAARMR